MSGSKPGASNSDQWETVKGKKGSRHNSPENPSPTEEQNTEKQRPAPAPQARPHTIQVVKTDQWKSEFDILMRPNKERVGLDYEVKHTKMRDTILQIQEL